MKLPKKYERIAQKQAAYLKKMYETPCEEAQELIRKANERPTMPSGMTQQEEIDWILSKADNQ